MENNNNGGLIAIIIILLVALLGVCGYVAYDKGLIFDNDKDNNQVDVNEEENKEPENIVNEDNTESNYVSLEIKDDNCINKRGMDYSINSSHGVSIVLNDDNTVTLNISSNAYLSLTNKEVSGIQSFTINNFSKKVIDILDSSIGQDIYGETLLFLMEDGSVEYLPIRYALYGGTVQSYGKLQDVEGIVKLYSAHALQEGDIVGANTILAQKADGTYYDLAPILQNTKNY